MELSLCAQSAVTPYHGSWAPNRGERDGFLSRAPTVGELEFLKHLRVREGYDKRNLRI